MPVQNNIKLNPLEAQLIENLTNRLGMKKIDVYRLAIANQYLTPYLAPAISDVVFEKTANEFLQLSGFNAFRKKILDILRNWYRESDRPIETKAMILDGLIDRFNKFLKETMVLSIVQACLTKSEPLVESTSAIFDVKKGRPKKPRQKGSHRVGRPSGKQGSDVKKKGTIEAAWMTDAKQGHAGSSMAKVKQVPA